MTRTPTINRRGLLGGVSALAAFGMTSRGRAMSARFGSDELASTALPATLILSQERWMGYALRNSLTSVLRAATAGVNTKTQPVMVLLPPGEADWGDVEDEDDILAALEDLAEEFNVYLAGAATVDADDSGDVETVGFVISADGDVILRVPKVTPDFTTGFSDSTCRLYNGHYKGAAAAVATPFGKIGMLPGEDILMPGLVRAAMLSGVELLLNPCRMSGNVSQARRELPWTMAYENWFLVATATPATQKTGEAIVQLPTATGLYDWQGGKIEATSGQSFLNTTVDIEVLRHGRAHISTNRYDNYPLILRDGVYGPVYADIAAQRDSADKRKDVPDSRAEWLEEAVTRIAAQAARRTPEDDLLDGYYALMAQPATASPLPKDGRREALMQNIRDALALVEGRSRRADSKLVIFPEFCFSGAGYRTIPDILSASVRFPGPELDLLSEFAQRNSIYVAGEFLEEDAKFPGRVFNTAFLLNDSGDLINKHHKVQCVDVIGTLRDTTPGSVFEQYVDEYGLDSLFTVADTPLGKLGHIICFEIMFPEISRLMALSGAELIIDSTAEGWGSFRPMWHACRRKRAFENTAYLAMSNKAHDPNAPPFWVSYGESMFIDHRGDVRDQITHNGPEVLQAYVDMKALRAARRDPAVNIPIWDEPAAYAAAYLANNAVPNDLWAENPDVFPYEGGDIHRSILEKFYARGVYEKPGA
jgi:predicted amidohydrolase